MSSEEQHSDAADAAGDVVESITSSELPSESGDGVSSTQNNNGEGNEEAASGFADSTSASSSSQNNSNDTTITTTSSAAAAASASAPASTTTAPVAAAEFKVFVGQIPRNGFHEQDLHNMFASFGDILDTKVMTDRQTRQGKGCGFVRFASRETAQRAIDTMHASTTMPGARNPLIVSWAGTNTSNNNNNNNTNYSNAPPASRAGGGGGRALTDTLGTESKVFYNNLPYSADEQEVRGMFGAYGQIADVVILRHLDTGRPKGSGFVRFENRDHASGAIAGLSGTSPFQGMRKPLEVRWAESPAERAERHASGKVGGGNNNTSGGYGGNNMGGGGGGAYGGGHGYGQQQQQQQNPYAQQQQQQQQQPYAAAAAYAQQQNPYAMYGQGAMGAMYGAAYGGYPMGYNPMMAMGGGVVPPGSNGVVPPGGGVGTPGTAASNPAAAAAAYAAYAAAAYGQYAASAYGAAPGAPTGGAAAATSAASMYGMMHSSAPSSGQQHQQQHNHHQYSAPSSSSSSSASSSTSAGADNTVYVHGLPENYTDAELMQLFSSVAPVVSSTVATDRATGRSRDFGFVTFNNKDSAVAAVNSLAGLAMPHGRRLKVEIKGSSAPGGRIGGGKF